MRRALVVSLALCGACGRFGFAPTEAADGDADGADAVLACGDATFCDDFNRTLTIPSGSAVWTTAECDPSATLAVDGTFDVVFAASTTADFRTCGLQSFATGASRAFQLDFDVTFDGTGSGYGVAIADVRATLATPNAAGVENISVQAHLLDGGRGQLDIVFFYPDASRSPDGTQYPGFNVGDSGAQRWLTLGQPCHVTVKGDFSTPSATMAVGRAS